MMRLPKFENFSYKRLLIDRANSTMLMVLASAAVLVTMALVASKALVSQNNYQQRVIKERKAANKQLIENVAAADKLVTSYKAFQSSPESVLGTKDNNSKIVLDALPSKYDFPALASSLEKLLTSGGYTIDGIAGSDQEASAEQNSSVPQPVEMPFQISVKASYEAIQKLVTDFERSIRPFQIKAMELSGDNSTVRLNLKATTFYQPTKKLDVRTKVIK